MRLTISHETAYHYEELVRSSIQYLRLTPHDSERQQVLSWQLDLPRPVRAQLDPFGNILHVLSLEEPHADWSSAPAAWSTSMKVVKPSTSCNHRCRSCASPASPKRMMRCAPSPASNAASGVTARR